MDVWTAFTLVLVILFLAAGFAGFLFGYVTGTLMERKRQGKKTTLSYLFGIEGQQERKKQNA